MVHGANVKHLIDLPSNFVDFFTAAQERGLNNEVAVCLVSGAVLLAGKKVKNLDLGGNQGAVAVGECSYHAISQHGGFGIYFLVKKSRVLLVDTRKQAFYPSLYVDEFGNEDVGLRRGKPLKLNVERHEELEGIWRRGDIAREVANRRQRVSHDTTIIREGYY